MSDAEKNENEGKFTFKISEGKETNEKGDTEEVKDGDKCETAEDLNKSHDPYFPPIITLPEVHVESGEKEEEELVCFTYFFYLLKCLYFMESEKWCFTLAQNYVFSLKFARNFTGTLTSATLPSGRREAPEM